MCVQTNILNAKRMHACPSYFVTVISEKHRKRLGEAMTKKVSEMTFKEFSEGARKKGAHEIIDDPNIGMLTVLRKEGFSEEEINRMKMDKAWKLYMDSASVIFQQYITGISRIVEQHPERASAFRPILEKLTEQLEKFNRELEKEKR